MVRPMVWNKIGFYNITDHEYETIVGSNTIKITIPLKEHYDYLSPGLYKYVHKIGERDVEVTFEIVEEEEID